MKKALHDLIKFKNVNHFYSNDNELFSKFLILFIDTLKPEFAFPVTNTYLMYKMLDRKIRVKPSYAFFTDRLQEEIYRKKSPPTYYLPVGYDDCRYLPETKMHISKAIKETAERIAELVDYVLTGTDISEKADTYIIECAQKLNKTIININEYKL